MDAALRTRGRGLKGASSSPQLLARHRAVRNKGDTPPLSTMQILDWADAHYSRTGEWPNAESGPIPEAPGETWGAVYSALVGGRRGKVSKPEIFLILIPVFRARATSPAPRGIETHVDEERRNAGLMPGIHFHANTIAPATISAPPTHWCQVSCSRSTIAASKMAKTTLSLSTGATRDASPS